MNSVSYLHVHLHHHAFYKWVKCVPSVHLVSVCQEMKPFN